MACVAGNFFYRPWSSSDSPLEGTGFELPVRGSGEAGCRRFFLRRLLGTGRRAAVQTPSLRATSHSTEPGSLRVAVSLQRAAADTVGIAEGGKIALSLSPHSCSESLACHSGGATRCSGDCCEVSGRLRGGRTRLRRPRSHRRDLIDERQGSGADANISNISPWRGVVHRGDATCPVERTGCWMSSERCRQR